MSNNSVGVAAAILFALSTPLIAFGQPLFGILGWGLSVITGYIALMKPLTRSIKPIKYERE